MFVSLYDKSRFWFSCRGKERYETIGFIDSILRSSLHLVSINGADGRHGANGIDQLILEGHGDGFVGGKGGGR